MNQSKVCVVQASIDFMGKMGPEAVLSIGQYDSLHELMRHLMNKGYGYNPELLIKFLRPLSYRMFEVKFWIPLGNALGDLALFGENQVMYRCDTWSMLLLAVVGYVNNSPCSFTIQERRGIKKELELFLDKLGELSNVKEGEIYEN